MPMASTRASSETMFKEKPKASITAKVPISDTGTAISGIRVARRLPRNRKTTITTRMKASIRVWITSSMLSQHEGGRVVGGLVGDALGELGLQPLHDRLDALGGGERVGAGRLEDGDQGAGAAVEAAERIAAAGAELDPADVAHADVGAVRVGADDDVLELLGLGQPALGLDVELELGVADRLGADAADGGLDVLPLQGVGDVGGREPECRQPVGGRARRACCSRGRRTGRRRRRRAPA